MIDLTYIRGFYPPQIANNANFQKHLLKEYIECLAMEWISQSAWSDKLAFIGLSQEDFIQMTDGIMRYLTLQGLRVEPRDKENPKLTAFRRNVYFPELLFSLQLTGHREERFLMKIEAQDQGIVYPREMATISRLGFYFSFNETIGSFDPSKGA